MANKYTTEQIEWLKEAYKLHSCNQLTPLFNEKFDTELSPNKIKSLLSRERITSGRDGRFKPGQVPFNKGVKGQRSSILTEFKKGNRPHNAYPIGAEKKDFYGYWKIKIAEPAVWKFKHRLLWEEINGPIPPGHIVIFVDQNKDNLNINNLALIKRNVAVRLNQNGYSNYASEIKPSVLALTRLDVAIREANK